MALSSLGRLLASLVIERSLAQPDVAFAWWLAGALCFFGGKSESWKNKSWVLTAANHTQVLLVQPISVTLSVDPITSTFLVLTRILNSCFYDLCRQNLVVGEQVKHDSDNRTRRHRNWSTNSVHGPLPVTVCFSIRMQSQKDIQHARCFSLLTKRNFSKLGMQSLLIWTKTYLNKAWIDSLLSPNKYSVFI